MWMLHSAALRIKMSGTQPLKLALILSLTLYFKWFTIVLLDVTHLGVVIKGMDLDALPIANIARILTKYIQGNTSR